MRNQIIPLAEQNRKVFGYSDEQIITSSKKHSSFDSLLAATIKSGMLEDVRIVSIESLQEISLNEKGDTFTITYVKSGATKKVSFMPEDGTSREAIAADLASIKRFKRSETVESKAKPMTLNLIALVAIVLFTWVARNMALDAQAGEHYEATGRRSGLKNLIANAVEAIGPTGIMIIGAIGVVYMIYRTYNRYQNPATVIKYN